MTVLIHPRGYRHEVAVVRLNASAGHGRWHVLEARDGQPVRGDRSKLQCGYRSRSLAEAAAARIVAHYQRCRWRRVTTTIGDP